MVRKRPAVYILADRPRGVLYVGVTSNVVARVRRHRAGSPGSFSTRYRTYRLVYVERHATMLAAIRRETQLKWWRRDWKIALIESQNPTWAELLPWEAE